MATCPNCFAESDAERCVCNTEKNPVVTQQEHDALFHQMCDVERELQTLRRACNEALTLLFDARAANLNGRTTVVDEFIERAAGKITKATPKRVLLNSEKESNNNG